MFHDAIRQALENGTDLDAAMVVAAAPMRQLILDMLRQRPFQPFRISMTGKYVHEIRNPETTALGPTTLHAREPDPHHPGQLRDRMILALIHIVSLEPLDADEPTAVVTPRERDQ